MKSRISILFVVLFALFAYSSPVAAFSGAGDGLSAETAFIITTCAQLQEMNDDLDAYYKLGNDIDCAETASWNVNLDEWEEGDTDNPLIPDPYTGVINNGYFGFEPIGRIDAENAGLGFTGTLDGQGHTISDLWIFRKEQSNVGLIGNANSATIRNITLDNARIVGGSSTGGFVGYGAEVVLEDLINTQGMVRAYLAYYGGGVAGIIEDVSTITDVTVTNGNVHGSGNTIGGLVGWINNSDLTGGTTSADVDGGEYIGGAFGYISNTSNVTDVTVSGDVESNDADDVIIPGFSKSGRYTGGFAGRIDNSTVSSVTVTGSVSADQDYAGGFAGIIEGQSEISDAIVSGDVSGDEYIGGFAGVINFSDVIDSTASGDVTAVGGYAGGFAGETLCGSSFFRSGAYGDVNAGNDYVGGFSGYDACEGPGSSFSQVSAHGHATSTGSFVGGFLGNSITSTITDAYAGGNVTGNNYVGGFFGSVTGSSVENVYSRGVVSGNEGSGDVGGFIGEFQSTTLTATFVDMDASAQELVCGTGDCSAVTSLTTVEAINQITYTDEGWDFGGIWEMDENTDGYPNFRWETFALDLLGSGTEEDPYQITECFTASESGYYELQNNITGVTASCIIIEADDVHIDGGQYTISADAESLEESAYGVEAARYNSVHISNLSLETFTDGIRLVDVHGTSTITNVFTLGMDDDGIELRGVTGMTISDSTIDDVGDEGVVVRTYVIEDTEIFNNNLVIEDNTILNTGDYGIRVEYVTDLVISGNDISDTEDDGVYASYIEDGEILDNVIDNVDSDGIYLEEGTNVVISENSITDSEGADGIDIDYDEEGSQNITVSGNTLTGIGDNGIEISYTTGITVTGNTMTVYDIGLDVYETTDATFSDNIIVPTTSEFFEIPSVTTSVYDLTGHEAEQILTTDYSSFTYTLPFTFNFKGRDITDITVGGNGVVELHENGESCIICGNSDYYRQYLTADALFASFDGLAISLSEDSRVSIFNPEENVVVIDWIGTTQADSDPVTYPIHFQLVLNSNGTVRWNFIQMDFQAYYFDMFTGAYDVESNEVYRAGLAISDPSSYAADLSGETEYELVEQYNSITGIDLEVVNDSSFISNDIHSDLWVVAVDIENVAFNDSDSGNTYRLASGEGAWTVFNIIDTNGDGYAESGTDRPFSQTTVGVEYWNGEGEDQYPASLVTAESTPTVTRNRSGSSRRRSQTASRQDTNRSDDDKQSNSNEDAEGDTSRGRGATQQFTPTTGARTPVSTIRELQRFLNTNGFPVALTGPGSLNNETDTFGALTRQALARFQAANGISPAIGVFGPITRAFINGLSAPSGTQPAPGVPVSTSAPVRDLELGARGDDVTKLQQLLINAGFPITSGATGYFGQQTKDALIAYQKAKNIAPATGYFGAVTRTQMKTAGIAGVWW